MNIDHEICGNLRQVILDRISVLAKARFSRDLAQYVCMKSGVDVAVDNLFDAFTVSIVGSVPGKRDDAVRISHPKTWIDAVKLRWFPKWILKKYPAQMQSHVIERGCTYPTIKICQDDHYPMAFMQQVTLDYWIPEKEESDD